MSKTFSRCQDCQRMEYIVDGGCVCEPCLRLATQSRVLLSHADSEIEQLRQQLAAANARVAQLESTIAACKAAGFVTEQGEVRRVAHDEPLPITADGYIATYGNSYWYWDTINGYCDPIEYGWTQRELESCRPQDAEYSWTTKPSLCYYDLDAAKASKQKGQP